MDVDQLRQDIEEARLKFRERVGVILLKASDDADKISLAIGEVSVPEAYDAWAKQVMQAIKEDSQRAEGPDGYSVRD